MNTLYNELALDMNSALSASRRVTMQISVPMHVKQETADKSAPVTSLSSDDQATKQEETMVSLCSCGWIPDLY